MSTQVYDVRAVQAASIPLAVVRRQVRQSDLTRVIPEDCGVVWNALKAQGIRGGRHVALYWERDPVIRLEVGAEVDVPFAEQGDLVRSATPAGLVASVTHLGPYGGLTRAHDALHDWCTAAQHRLAGPSWEVYGHWMSEWDRDPSQIRTDIFYLLEDASQT
jgi:effector-binding domain-containing protein